MIFHIHPSILLHACTLVPKFPLTSHCVKPKRRETGFAKRCNARAILSPSPSASPHSLPSAVSCCIISTNRERRGIPEDQCFHRHRPHTTGREEEKGKETVDMSGSEERASTLLWYYTVLHVVLRGKGKGHVLCARRRRRRPSQNGSNG